MFVTHDQVEALSIADRVAVMNQGRILQEGAQTEIYARPNDLFVARFLGSANVVGGKVEGDERIVLEANGWSLTLRSGCKSGDLVDIVLRPETLTLSTVAPADQINMLPGTVVASAFQGSSVEYEVDVGKLGLRVLVPAQLQIARGTAVWIGIPRTARAVFRRESS